MPVADTSELFVRSVKLLAMTGIDTVDGSGHRVEQVRLPKQTGPVDGSGLQKIVRFLMKTLLQDHPTLLDHSDIRNLMDSDFCKNSLGLQISHFPLLRTLADGRELSGHTRYCKDPYADKYYVCSQGWKAYHRVNAGALARYLDGIIQRRAGHPGQAALRRHREDLQRIGE